MTSNDKTKVNAPAPRPAFRAMPAGELEARRAKLEAKGRAIYAAGAAWCGARKAKMEEERHEQIQEKARAVLKDRADELVKEGGGS